MSSKRIPHFTPLNFSFAFCILVSVHFQQFNNVIAGPHQNVISFERFLLNLHFHPPLFLYTIPVAMIVYKPNILIMFH